MNKILLAFLDNRPIASISVLIEVVIVNGEPVLNTKYWKGEDVIVFTGSASDLWRINKGRSVFGPEHFRYSRDIK